MAAAADAAWAAADTLHVAARALRNPHLRCAADSYDRAARAQYGRLPRRSRDGDQLRQTARLIALAGHLTGDTTLAAIALMAQLVALAAAVAEGPTNGVVAGRLYISPHTVNTHMRHVFAMLGVPNRVALAAVVHHSIK